MHTPRIAIVHDWLVQPGGAELVLREILGAFPAAELFTVVDHMPAERRRAFADRPSRTTWLQHVPGVARHYRTLLPVMPAAVAMLDLSAYDLVLSLSHAVAQGVRVGAHQLQLSFCFTPMRYAWDLREQYLAEVGWTGGIRGALARTVLERMRRWDARASQRVDAFATTSAYVRERIMRCYGREAAVLGAPVDVEYFTPDGPHGPEYVTASRFAPYKRVPLIARAFAAMPERRLVIIGDGPERAAVQEALAPNVTWLGELPRDALRDRLRSARAFLFSAEEDFGIVPLEAQACGTPVIALGKGGALETVVGSGAARTGVFFPEATVGGIMQAVRDFEALDPAIEPVACRANALRFSAAQFRAAVAAWVEGEWSSFVRTGRRSARR